MLYPLLVSQLLPYRATPTRFVLAYSGGVDSQVLLHLMARYLEEHSQHRCIAVHVHHGLSQHADNWAEQCQQRAKALGIVCHVEHVELALGAQISTEQAARDARYQVLARHMDSDSVLLTAQHADDQLETFLLALKRGSGPAGLAAMPVCTEFVDGLHLRPLLHSSRDEIEAYASEHQLSWVEDESNQDTRYDRNFIRHQVAPLLLERWPGMRKAVMRSAQLCGEQQAMLESLLMDKLERALNADFSLDISGLEDERIGSQLIRLWLKRQQAQMPSQAQLKQIWHSVVMAKADANPQCRWHHHEVRRSQGRLYQINQWRDVSQWQTSCELTSGMETRVNLPDNLGSLSINLGSSGEENGSQQRLRTPKVDEPISIRFDPTGQEVKPVGRVGKRKIKKLYQEYGVPSWLRRRTPLVFYGDKLAAVVGLFVVEEFAGSELTIEWQR